MKAEIKIYDNSIRILINNLPHIHIKENEFVGFYSWIEDKRHYFIEFYLKNKTFLVEYDEKEKWKTILTLLNEHL